MFRKIFRLDIFFKKLYNLCDDEMRENEKMIRNKKSFLLHLYLFKNIHLNLLFSYIMKNEDTQCDLSSFKSFSEDVNIAPVDSLLPLPLL